MNERGLVSELPCRGFPGQDGDESASENFSEGTSCTSSNSSNVSLQSSNTEPLQISPLTSSASSIELDDGAQVSSTILPTDKDQRPSSSGI